MIRVLSVTLAVDGGTPRSWRNDVADAIVQDLIELGSRGRCCMLLLNTRSDYILSLHV